MDEDILTPAILDSYLQVPFSSGTILDAVQQARLVAPQQFCNKLLQNCGIWPCLGKGPHVTQISRTEPLNARKLSPKVLSQPIDHLCSPALGIKPRRDVPANRPVQQDEFSIDGQGRTRLGGTDAFLDVFEEGRITRG